MITLAYLLPIVAEPTTETGGGFVNNTDILYTARQQYGNLKDCWSWLNW